MTELSLWFSKSGAQLYELERTAFKGNPDAGEIVAVRGKTAGAYRGAGTFQWTPGVKALAVVFLFALGRQIRGTKTFLPLIEGERGSLASSLDYALNKQPEWLFDMFGADGKGNAYARQLLLRSNTGRRRSGPVSVSLNEQLLPPTAIKIYVSDSLIKDADTLRVMALTIMSSDVERESEEQEENGGEDEQSSGASNREISNSSSGATNASDNGLSNSINRLMNNTAYYFGSGQERAPIIMPVSETDLTDIHEYEKEHFPTSHATTETLKSWLQHDANNYMCIKEPGQSFLAYYLIMFLKPEAMHKYLIGELNEVDIAPEHILPPLPEVYAQQETVHITTFASRTHATMFTVDLLWHLIGRLLDFGINGRLHTISTEVSTNDGKVLVERFGFHMMRKTASGGLLYQLQPSLAMAREWEWRYKQRTFCRMPVDKLQAIYS